MSHKATDNDHRIIDTTSIALNGKIGQDDDVARLRQQIELGSSDRWAQDLKSQRDS